MQQQRDLHECQHLPFTPRGLIPTQKCHSSVGNIGSSSQIQLFLLGPYTCSAEFNQPNKNSGRSFRLCTWKKKKTFFSKVLYSRQKHTYRIYWEQQLILLPSWSTGTTEQVQHEELEIILLCKHTFHPLKKQIRGRYKHLIY